MKTLYIDCGMGAAGDMLTAALLELVPDKDAFVDRLNQLGIPGVTFKAEPSVKCGITGTHMTVLVDGEEEESHDHHHHHDHEHADHDHEEHEHHHHHDHEHADHDHEAHEHHHHHHDHDHEHADHDHEEHEHHHHHHDHDHEHGHHHHTGMHEIEHIVRDHLPVSDKVKNDVMAIYHLIAEAEGHVHGKPVDQIHFHEVGSMDAVADVTAVCLLMEELQPDRVVVSPVHVGSGKVKCAHGILLVPAPATAYILKDVPIYSGEIKGELCTPTGAALLKYFADEFASMPIMRVQSIGYGMGKKDFEAANCVRVQLGADESKSECRKGGCDEGCHDDIVSRGDVVELSCNLDDMTGEAIGYAMDLLMEEGALDVYTTPIGMKKSRPGVMLSVLCKEQDREKMVRLIFAHTTTLGIRENVMKRYTLERTASVLHSSLGDVQVKTSSGYGVEREKYEYRDLAAIAKAQNLSLQEVRSILDTERSE